MSASASNGTSQLPKRSEIKAFSEEIQGPRKVLPDRLDKIKETVKNWEQIVNNSGVQGPLIRMLGRDLGDLNKMIDDCSSRSTSSSSATSAAAPFGSVNNVAAALATLSAQKACLNRLQAAAATSTSSALQASSSASSSPAAPPSSAGNRERKLANLQDQLEILNGNILKGIQLNPADVQNLKKDWAELFGKWEVIPLDLPNLRNPRELFEDLGGVNMDQPAAASSSSSSSSSPNPPGGTNTAKPAAAASSSSSSSSSSSGPGVSSRMDGQLRMKAYAARAAEDAVEAFESIGYQEQQEQPLNAGMFETDKVLRICDPDAALRLRQRRDDVLNAMYALSAKDAVEVFEASLGAGNTTADLLPIAEKMIEIFGKFDKFSDIQDETLNRLIARRNAAMEAFIRPVAESVTLFEAAARTSDPKAAYDNMGAKFAEFANISDSTLRKLMDRRNDLLRIRFAPTIPLHDLEIFKRSLSKFTNEQILKLQQMKEKCNSLEDWLALERYEKECFQRLNVYKSSFIRDLALQNGALKVIDPISLTYRLEEYKISINTELSMEFERIAAPFTRFRHGRAIEQDAYLFANFSVEDMGSQGNCLFRSLAGVEGNELGRSAKASADANHMKIRQDIVKHIRSNKAQYIDKIAERITTDPVANKQFPGFNKANDHHFELYLQWMGRWGTWGGEAEINAYCDMTNRPRVVVTNMDGVRRVDMLDPQYPAVSAAKQKPVVLQVLGQSHFQAMLPKYTARG